MAWNDDIVIRGAAAFGCDDVRKVAGRDFVDNADQAFMPTIFVIFVMVILIWVVLGGIAEASIGKAGLDIRHSVKVEVESEGGDLDVNLRQRLDASSLLKGLIAEIGTVRKIQICS